MTGPALWTRDAPLAGEDRAESRDPTPGDEGFEPVGALRRRQRRPRSSPQYARIATRTALGCSVAAVSIGVAALLGWIFDVTVLTRVSSEYVSMKATTAVCFVLSGAALVLNVTRPGSRATQRVSLGMVLVTVGLAGTALMETIVGLDTGLGEALFEDTGPLGARPGLMSPLTAGSFLLIGTATALLWWPRRSAWLREILAAAVAVVAYAGLIGYLFGAESLQSFGLLTRMALHTALGFSLLSTAVLCAEPEVAPFDVFVSRGVGGQLTRRLVPIVILLLPAIGAARLHAQRVGLVSTELGLALMVLVTGAILVGVVLWTSDSLGRSEEALRDREQELKSILDNAQVAIFVKDLEGRYRLLNRFAASYLPEASSPLGQTDFDLLPAAIAEVLWQNDRTVLDTQTELRAEERVTRHDGERTMLSVKFPVYDAEGGISGVCGISTDVTDSKRAEDAVRNLNAELEARVTQRTAALEASNRELESFTYTVSHDLRAPLRAIEGFSGILDRDWSDRLSDDGRHCLERIRVNVMHMTHLVEDLLQFSRISREIPHWEVVEMGTLVEKVLDRYQEEISSRGVQVEVLDVPGCTGDPHLLEQVWANLLDNALKFTRLSGEARIRLAGVARGGRIVYSVEDNGVGFDSRYKDKLFEVFQRLHSPDEFEGTGIGLAIVERIVGAHGGEVGAECDPGVWTRFSFTIPLQGAERRGDG